MEKDNRELTSSKEMNLLSKETDYVIGQDNIQIYGLDVHNPVFAMSASLVLIFSSLALAFPETSTSILVGSRDLILDLFDTMFSLSIIALTCFILFLIISPYGRIRIGGENAKTEFKFISWVCMLFSAGVGIGMTFYGAAEPLAYFTGIYGTPLGVTAETPEAYRLAFSATLFHWGISGWSVYALIGLSIGFFTFNRGLPLTIRSIFYPLLGERVWGWPGHIIDVVAVLSTLFGLATSLGLGAQQVSSGLNYLFDIPKNHQTQSLIIISISCLAIYSVVRGLDNGVRKLSNINIGMAICLMFFIILAGPTKTIIFSYSDNLANYFVDIFSLSALNRQEDKQWYHDWTIFYWAWWISWSPFVGIFIARISKGRTVREFLAVVMSAPLLFSLIWFSSFGSTAISQYEANIGSLPNNAGDTSLVLFLMLENLVFPTISSLFALALLVFFFVTSSDSGSLVVDSITSGGKLNAPKLQRIFWASVQGLLAIVLLIGGGSSALGAIQAGAISMALPFVVILLAASISLTLGLYSELSYLKTKTLHKESDAYEK
ncbi:MAG: BCCT family transporter [Paracoccaceae bacterium]|nr:BCCT family transporter [Paracoccaceae bacterium]